MNNIYEQDKEKLKEFKQRFNKDFQDKACQMDWKHEYYFSHYEDETDPQSTSAFVRKYAIMICRHCGHYIKQQVF